jgi:iron complex outermembrane receptor protein
MWGDSGSAVLRQELGSKVQGEISMRGFQTLVSAPIFLALSAGVVVAEESFQLEEVVVTAQKRAENIQNVPLSIVSVSGEALQNAGVNNVSDLGKLAPSLQINPGLFAAGVIIRIRGFGSAPNTATDSDVATYVDSAFIPRPGAIMSSFLDVKNVEVLNGPQGTLFGRNAAMGAISVNTNAPSTDKSSFAGSVEAGKYGTHALTGVANFPVSDNFALRVAYKNSHTDGLYDNLLDGKTYGKSDQNVGRISAKWDFSDSVSWTVRADAATINGDGVYASAVYADTASAAQLTALSGFVTRFGGTPPVISSEPSYKVNQVYPGNFNRDRQTGVTSDLGWNFTPALSLRLINTYRDWDNSQLAGDTIGTSLSMLSVGIATKSKALSHELQLVSQKGAFLGNKLGFTSGLYYFKEDYSIDTRFNVGTSFCTVVLTSAGRAVLIPGCQAGAQFGAGLVNFAQRATSNAAYVQLDYALLPNLELDIGARYTKDKKSATFRQQAINALAAGQLVTNEGPYPLGFDDNNSSVRASLSWHASDKIMPFVTFSTGYKSGGFNGGGSNFVQNAAARTFESEKVDDVELGVKSVLWAGRVQLNATLFDTKLKNFQDRSFNGVGFVVRNAGDVKSRGLDLDGQFRVLPSLSFNAALTYLDAKYAKAINSPALEGCGALASPAVPPAGSICASMQYTPAFPAPTGQTSQPSQNLTGRTIAYAPKFHGNVGVKWDSRPFASGYVVTVAATENYSASFLTSNTNNPQSEVPSYSTTDLRVSLNSADDRWQLDLFGTNVFDKRYYVATVAQVLGAQMGLNNAATGATLFRGSLGDPARFGARVSVKF